MNPGILVLVATLVVGLFIIIGLVVSRQGGDEDPAPAPESGGQRLSEVVRINAYLDPAGLGDSDAVFALVSRFNGLGATTPKQLEAPAAREAVRGLEGELEFLCRGSKRFDACADRCSCDNSREHTSVLAWPLDRDRSLKH